MSGNFVNISRLRELWDFNESEGVRVCCVPSVARALRGWPEGSLKSRSFRVYGVTNMFSAELEPHTQNLVPRRSILREKAAVLANGAERPT